MPLSYFRSFGYTEGSSFLHRLDPRTKLVMGLCAAAVFTFLVVGVVTYALFALLLFLTASTVGLRSQVLRLMRSSLIFALLLFAINLYFLRELYVSIYIVERFLIFVQLFSVLGQTTMPDEVSLALRKLGAPYSFTLAFNMAMRFLPTVAAELDSITASQKSRGLELDRGNFVSRMRNYIPIMVPLLVNAVIRIDQVAEALESRCFGAAKEPTTLDDIAMHLRDWAVVAATVASTSLLVWAFVISHHPLMLP
ncbi:MAG: energy-coupling factor transporter transmembrane component T [Thermoprotei archaeon]